MAITRARSPVVWIRRILLLIGILGIGTLALMLSAYQFGRSGMDDESSDDRATAETDESTLTAGEGFDFTHYLQGRQIFHIQADKSLQDREDTTYLETVVLDIFREDGVTYRVTSRNAQVNEETWDARLEGDVVVSGWGDLELEARALDLQHDGQLLVSRGPVEFRYPPDLEGRATNLQLDRRTDTISLTGGVHIRSRAGSPVPTRLDCERLVYKRGEGMIRALDDVFIRYGQQELSSRALTIFLLEDGKSLRTLRARWEVSGSARAPDDFGGEMQMAFFGDFLEVEPRAENPAAKRIKLQGGNGQAASIKVVSADGVGRLLRASVLNGELLEDRPAYIDGVGQPLLIDEFFDLPEPYPLRQICAHRASARFLSDGTLSQLYLDRQVELWNENLHLSGGDRAQVDLETGKIEITGPDVELYSDRGDLSAPKITYFRDRGLVRAESGVRARLESGTATALEMAPFGQGQGPIRVESQEAFYTTEPPAFTFQGGVRAWREKNLLLADELRGDQSTRQMSASGNVQTRWLSNPRAGAPAGTIPQPIEVRSELLTYRQAENNVIYSGKVRVDQGRSKLSCTELSVELDDGGHRTRRMICREDVKLTDPQTGRVTGDSAVYTVADDRVEIFGNRVELIDAQNNRVQGRYLTYDLEGGRVKISSQAPGMGAP